MDSMQETPPVRVKFGPGESDDVSLPIASRMLMIMRDKHAELFGRVFLEAYGIVKKARASANGTRP